MFLDVKIETLEERYGPAYKWLVGITCIVGVITGFVSATASFVSLPDVQGFFGIGQDRGQWIATTWMAAMVVFFLVSNKLVQAFGERMVFLATLIMFSCGAFLSGLTEYFGLFLIGRIMQGATVGILMPLSMSIIFNVFPVHQRGLAMGFFGMGILFATAIGPVMGGIVVDEFNWRMSYIAPVIFAVMAFPAGLIFMPSKAPALRKFDIDWPSFALLCLFMVCLLWVLGNGQRYGWQSDLILMGTVTGVAAFAVFVYLQLASTRPMLDLSLLRYGPFAASAFVNLVFGTGFAATTLFFPIFVQEVQSFTASRAGFVILPAGITMIVFALISGMLADRIRERYVIIAGLVVFGIGTGYMVEADVNASFWFVAGLAVVGRIGLGLMMPALDKVALQSIPREKVGGASGAVNFFRQVGGAAGMGLATVIVEMRTHYHIDVITGTQSAGNWATESYRKMLEPFFNAAGVPDNMFNAVSLHQLGLAITAQAETMGYQDMFFLLGLFFIIGLIPAWFATRPRAVRKTVEADAAGAA